MTILENYDEKNPAAPFGEVAVPLDDVPCPAWAAALNDTPSPGVVVVSVVPSE